ncbi:hypothetical protein ACS0TY_033061 [Phlomoides rotata]
MKMVGLIGCSILWEVLAGNFEELIPPSERYIFKFCSKEELKRWHLYSDSEYGMEV